MSNSSGVNVGETSGTPERPRSGVVVALVAVLAAECLALVAATVFLVFEILVAAAQSVTSAIALTVVVAIGTAWVGAIVVGAWRGQSWSRGASIVVQILLMAVALGSFQGILPRPDIGWILLIPAFAVLALLFVRPTREWFAPRG